MAADSCGVMGMLLGLSAGVHASWSAVFGPGCRMSGGAIKDPTLFDGLGPCFGLVQITGSILLGKVLRVFLCFNACARQLSRWHLKGIAKTTWHMVKGDTSSCGCS